MPKQPSVSVKTLLAFHPGSIRRVNGRQAAQSTMPNPRLWLNWLWNMARLLCRIPSTASASGAIENPRHTAQIRHAVRRFPVLPVRKANTLPAARCARGEGIGYFIFEITGPVSSNR